MVDNSKEMAEIFKALGDETRIKMVQLLQGKELCVCDIIDEFSISQPAVSHHLKILKQAGIVMDAREGKWIFYRLNPAVWDVIFQFISCINHGSVEVNRCQPSSKCRL